jgi:hypothetical protein
MICVTPSQRDESRVYKTHIGIVSTRKESVKVPRGWLSDHVLLEVIRSYLPPVAAPWLSYAKPQPFWMT